MVKWLEFIQESGLFRQAVGETRIKSRPFIRYPKWIINWFSKTKLYRVVESKHKFEIFLFSNVSWFVCYWCLAECYSKYNDMDSDGFEEILDNYYEVVHSIQDYQVIPHRNKIKYIRGVLIDRTGLNDCDTVRRYIEDDFEVEGLEEYIDEYAQKFVDTLDQLCEYLNDNPNKYVYTL